MALYKGGMAPEGPGRDVCESFPFYEYMLDYNVANFEWT